MYGTTKHLLLLCLLLISLASCLKPVYDEKEKLCDVKNEISRLEQLMMETKNECAMKNNCPKGLHFSGTNKEYAILKEDQPAKSGYVSTAVHGGTGGGLDAITSCFWIKTTKTTEEPTMLSYAVPKRDNEFCIYLLQNNIRVLFKHDYTLGGDDYKTGVRVSDGQWHHVCITWKSGNGSVEVYKDGVFQTQRTGAITGKRIEPAGIWVIGQDQDTLGGGFEEVDAFQGALTDVNVWDRVLDASEIATLASERCGFGIQGNYKAYKDFLAQGPVRKVKPACCKDTFY